jgi:hypothetical protein
MAGALLAGALLATATMAQETVTVASMQVDPAERSRAVLGFDEAIDCPMLELGSEHVAVFMTYVQDYPPRMVSVGRGTDKLMCEVGAAGCSWPPTR